MITEISRAANKQSQATVRTSQPSLPAPLALPILILQVQHAASFKGALVTFSSPGLFHTGMHLLVCGLCAVLRAGRLLPVDVVTCLRWLWLSSRLWFLAGIRGSWISCAHCLDFFCDWSFAGAGAAINVSLGAFPLLTSGSRPPPSILPRWRYPMAKYFYSSLSYVCSSSHTYLVPLWMCISTS